MNNPKNLLLIALALLGFMLYQQWQLDYGPKPTSVNPKSELQVSDVTDTIPDDIPDIDKSEISNLSSETPNLEPTRPSSEIINVETNVLKLKIDTLGGSIVYSELKQYPVSKKSKQNVVLLEKGSQNYFAQSGLLSPQQSFNHNDQYKAERLNYTVNDGEIEIPLTISNNGVKLTKIYKFSADSYLIDLEHKVENQSAATWQGMQYRQLQRDNPWKNNTPGFNDASRMSFKGAGYFEPNEGYNKLDFDDFVDETYTRNVDNANWIAMVQHYFFSGFVLGDSKEKIETKFLKDSKTPYLIRSSSPYQQIESGQSESFETQLYIGPKIQEELPKIAKGLDLTVDYGMFTAIAKPLFWVLNKIHSIVGNWGWSIILLTILIKLLFFKLSEKQYKSMARMRKLQPRIKTLKDRYKDNKPKFNEEMMKLYKKEKVNPMGGCLPVLIQIPVFIALYWVLLESVELRQAPFMLWLQDLSSPDPYFILPAINAAAMYMTQRLSPTPGMDPMQEKIMKFMPIGFSVMFAFFQSGLVLYWAVNSVLSLIQQWVITKRIDADPKA